METLKFAPLGNALVISDTDLEKTFIALYKPDTDTYQLFEKFIPDLPNITFRMLADSEFDEETEHYALGTGKTNDELQAYGEGIAGDLNTKKVALGMYSGYRFLRVGWELFDGSVVMQNLPYLLFVSDITITTDKNISDEYFIWGNFAGGKMQYKLNISSSDLNDIKVDYKGIVRSLNIYISNLHPWFKYNDWTTEQEHSLCYDDVVGMTYEQVKQWMEDKINLYELIRIQIDDLTADTDTDIGRIDGSILTSKTQMVMPSTAIHHLFGKRLFSYNQRVLLGDVKNILFKGYSLKGFAQPGSNNITAPTPYQIGMEFDISTPDGTKTVFSGWTEIDYWDSILSQFRFNLWTTFWGYPDSRAESMRFLIHDGTNVRLLTELKLKALYVHNIAIQTFDAFKDIGEHLISFKGPYSDYPIHPLTNVNDEYYDSDRIQACELSNPFYYPAINSYRVQGFVRGMATNAVPLSQGQFGQFPIFAFTSQGIWTLNIGDGNVFVTSIRPMSDVICTHPESIVGINGGVLFLSNQGLMIISGINPQIISELVIGSPVSPMTGQINYEFCINNPNTYQPKPFLTPDNFETYAQGAYFAIVDVNLKNSLEKEIICSNPNYIFSYAFNISSKCWYKKTQVFETIVYDYPKVYGYKQILGTHYLYDLTKESETSSQLIHLETRPISFNELLSYKKLQRLLIYGYVHPLTQNPFSIYLFGSVDMVNWSILKASNIITPGEIPAIGRSTFSCKAYILVIGGNVMYDSYIAGIIADIEKRYQFKLH